MGIFLIGVSVGMVVGMLFMTLFAVSAQSERNMNETTLEIIRGNQEAGYYTSISIPEKPENTQHNIEF